MFRTFIMFAMAFAASLTPPASAAFIYFGDRERIPQPLEPVAIDLDNDGGNDLEVVWQPIFLGGEQDAIGGRLLLFSRPNATLLVSDAKLVRLPKPAPALLELPEKTDWVQGNQQGLEVSVLSRFDGDEWSNGWEVGVSGSLLVLLEKPDGVIQGRLDFRMEADHAVIEGWGVDNHRLPDAIEGAGSLRFNPINSTLKLKAVRPRIGVLVECSANLKNFSPDRMYLATPATDTCELAMPQAAVSTEFFRLRLRP